MGDWRDIAVESLMVATDIGLTVLFYKLYKDKCATASQLEEFEPLPLCDLKQLVDQQPNGVVEYGIVEGLVYPIGDSLKSQYTEDKGPIKHLKRVLHKRERYRGFWTDHASVMSESYDRVPFALFDKRGGNSIFVTDPGSAHCLTESLHTTFDKFEPNNRSLTESVFDRVVGEITKGYQTTEQILKNGTTMLGLGKIVSNRGSLELRRPTTSNSPYIVTSMSKEELIQYIRTKATVFKVIAGIFGITGIVLLWVTVRPRIRTWIDNRRSREALNEVREQLIRMREAADPASPQPQANNVDEGGHNGNSCVICWNNAREIANRPCGHVCSCLGCYEAMPNPKKCPVCREELADVIPIFIA